MGQGRFFLVLVFVGLIGWNVQGQTGDTIQISTEKVHSPRKAALFSTALPGLGQAYNGTYAKKNKLLYFGKIPVIYGLGGFLAYNISQYHQDYTQFRDALLAREDSTFSYSGNLFTGIYTNDGLRVRKDFNKRQRDVNIIFALGLYVLQIIDATVDAHLMGFEIVDDIGPTKVHMIVEPTMMENRAFGRTFTPGVSLHINFL